MSFVRAFDESLKDKYELVLVSPRNYFVYTPLLPAMCAGTVEERSIVEPVRAVLGSKGKFFEAKCTDIMPEEKNIVACFPGGWASGWGSQHASVGAEAGDVLCSGVARGRGTSKPVYQVCGGGGRVGQLAAGGHGCRRECMQQAGVIFCFRCTPSGVSTGPPSDPLVCLHPRPLLNHPAEDAGFPEACFKIPYDYLVLGVG